MKKFILTTDSSCDVNKDWLKSVGAHYIPLTYTMENVTYEDNFCSDSEYVSFYNEIKQGKTSVTSQINAYIHENFWSELLGKEDLPIVHLSMSSGLSGTYESALEGKNNLIEKFPSAKVFVSDTLSTTYGHRLLLDVALKMQSEGKSAEETFEQLEQLKHKVHHWVMVDDLNHLKRGGRMSGGKAFIGTILGIKPIVVMNHLGKLAVVGKKMGVNSALRELANKVEELAVDLNNQTLYICHADALENAEKIKNIIQEKYTCPIQIGFIGPVIGSHTGTGTISVMFVSNSPRLTTV